MFDEDTIPLLPKITRIKLIFYQFADPEKKIQKRTHLFSPFFKKKKPNRSFHPIQSTQNRVSIAAKHSTLVLLLPFIPAKPINFASVQVSRVLSRS